MQTRKELVDRTINTDGEAISYRYLDGLLIEDQMTLYMRHFLAKLATSTTPDLDKSGSDFRKVRNYLIRLRVEQK